MQVIDLQSTNGILHNGVRVLEALLEDGDKIIFGGAKSTAVNHQPGPKVIRFLRPF